MAWSLPIQRSRGRAHPALLKLCPLLTFVYSIYVCKKTQEMGNVLACARLNVKGQMSLRLSNLTSQSPQFLQHEFNLPHQIAFSFLSLRLLQHILQYCTKCKFLRKSQSRLVTSDSHCMKVLTLVPELIASHKKIPRQRCNRHL